MLWPTPPVLFDQSLTENSIQMVSAPYLARSCHWKKLIFLIECKRCHLQYIGENKPQLSERFGKHQVGHSINDVRLMPIELIRSKRDLVRKAWEAHLINKAKTLHPFGINRRDEARQWHFWHLFNHSLPIIVTYLYLNFYCNGFLFTYFFPLSPWGRFVLQTEK